MAKTDAFIGSIDQGTTSTRFIIYDKHAKAIGSHQIEFTQFCPKAGWVEHDPMEIIESVKVCISKAIDKASVDGYNVDKSLKGIGITNQRETIVTPPKYHSRKHRRACDVLGSLPPITLNS
ncbi:putative glycerol kinase [Helianthus annuus]|nr:putative glycerol kinase [Helianthus annuus]